MIVLAFLAGAAAFLIAFAFLTATIRSIYDCAWSEAALLAASVLLVLGVLTCLNLIASNP